MWFRYERDKGCDDMRKWAEADMGKWNKIKEVNEFEFGECVDLMWERMIYEMKIIELSWSEWLGVGWILKEVYDVIWERIDLRVQDDCVERRNVRLRDNQERKVQIWMMSLMKGVNERVWWMYRCEKG